MPYDVTIAIDAKQTGLTLKGQWYDGSGAVGSEITTGFTADTAGGYLWKGQIPSDTFAGSFVAYTGTYSLATRIGSVAITPACADFAASDLRKLNGATYAPDVNPVYNTNVVTMDSGVTTSIVNAVVSGLASSFTTVTTAIAGVPAAVWAVTTKIVTSIAAGGITPGSYANLFAGGTVAASPTPTTTSFRGVGTDLPASLDFFIGQSVQFTSGQNKFKSAIITGYSASKDFTFASDDALAFAPAAGDTFTVLGKARKATA